MKGVIYARYSSDNQREESIEGQIRECRAFAEKQGIDIIAGVDEVGRGPLVGPVVAACVVLPVDFVLDGLTDSKKLSEKKKKSI